MSLTDEVRDVRDLYDRWSSGYDADEMLETEYVHLNKEYLQTFEKYRNKIRPGLVLDLGCGTGNDAIALVRLGFKVVGLDVSSRSLEIARQKVERLRLKPQVDFVVCDIHHLPITKRSADSIVSLGFMLSHTPHLSSVIREISRILRDHGYFILDFEGKKSLDLPFWIADTVMRRDFLGNESLTFRSFVGFLRTGSFQWKCNSRTKGFLGSISLYATSPAQATGILKANNLVPNGIHVVQMMRSLYAISSYHPVLDKVTRVIAKNLGHKVKKMKLTSFLADAFLIAGYKQESNALA